ncbi:MAG TPA: histidinol dehydrogenase [Phycisphaerae bacterium]|nr:histidinol dehydrogenase [Phycisphaerae bacterium]
MIRRMDCRTPRGRAALETLRAGLSAEQGMVSGGYAAQVETEVRRILDDVRRRGDAAVCEWTTTLDRASIAPVDLRVPAETLEAAYNAMPRDFIRTVTRVRDAVRRFQRHILHKSPATLDRDGRRLGLIYRPLARVGVYVPGGRAFYPSSVVMAAVPALSAGVPQVALASPPTADGDIHPAVLATCRVCGISEVYRMGGTPAIAAFAYGTESVPAVEKVVGPGNQYVQTAKKMVYGRVDIDSLAGPSEVVVLADASADARLVAADMLSQAEHDPGSAILVTPDEALAEAVAAELEGQVATLKRAEAIRQALKKYSAIVLVADMDQAAAVTNLLAPEHLEIQARRPKDILRSIRCAGAVFVGRYTPVAVGDYVAGPSHTLPTGGTARWASGLTANDFLRSMSVIEYDRGALAADADDLYRMADVEGLSAHAESVRKRLGGA